MFGEELRVLAETEATSFSVACPNCGFVICQFNVEAPGGVTGFEAVCGDCDSAVFLADAVAIPDGPGQEVDVPVEDLRDTALEYYDRTERRRPISGSDWRWSR